jgi:hypothetical protein
MLAALLFACVWHRSPDAGAGQEPRVCFPRSVIVALNAVLAPGSALLSLAGRRVLARRPEDGISLPCVWASC